MIETLLAWQDCHHHPLVTCCPSHSSLHVTPDVTLVTGQPPGTQWSPRHQCPLTEPGQPHISVSVLQRMRGEAGPSPQQPASHPDLALHSTLSSHKTQHSGPANIKIWLIFWMPRDQTVNTLLNSLIYGSNHSIVTRSNFLIFFFDWFPPQWS